jgi:hypothetical protein
MADTDNLPINTRQLPDMQQSALPPTNPIPQMPQSYADIISQVTQLPAYQQPAGQLQDIYQREAAIRQQQANMQVPPMGYRPKFESPAGKGVMGGIGAVLGDIGKGALMGLAATRPGQAVQGAIYGPGMHQYQAQRQQLADQLSTLKSQQEIPQEQISDVAKLGSGAGMYGYRQDELGIQQQKANTGEENAQTKRMTAQSQAEFRQFLQGLDTKKLDLETRKLLVNSKLREMGIDVQRDRNNVIMSLGNQRINLDGSKFDAAVNNKNQGFFDQVMQAFGVKGYEGVGGGSTQPIDTRAPATKAVSGKAASGGSSKPATSQSDNLQPPSAANPGYKWQHKGSGKNIQWRQVPQ